MCFGEDRSEGPGPGSGRGLAGDMAVAVVAVVAAAAALVVKCCPPVCARKLSRLEILMKCAAALELMELHL